MGKESQVEIHEGSGNLYRYVYDEESKQTRYRGPVGDAPPIGEEEFLSQREAVNCPESDCPECGSNDVKGIGGNIIWCEKCKKHLMLPFNIYRSRIAINGKLTKFDEEVLSMMSGVLKGNTSTLHRGEAKTKENNISIHRRHGNVDGDRSDPEWDILYATKQEKPLFRMLEKLSGVFEYERDEDDLRVRVRQGNKGLLKLEERSIDNREKEFYIVEDGERHRIATMTSTQDPSSPTYWSYTVKSDYPEFQMVEDSALTVNFEMKKRFVSLQLDNITR